MTKYLVVVTNRPSIKNPAKWYMAHKTYHVVEAAEAMEAHKQALSECFSRGTWGTPHRFGDQVEVERCVPQDKR